MKLASKLNLALLVGIVGFLTVTAPIIRNREMMLLEASAKKELCTVGRAVRPVFIRTWHNEGPAAAIGLLSAEAGDAPPPPRIVTHWIPAGEIPGGALADELGQGQEVFLTPEGSQDDIRLYLPVLERGMPAGALELATSLRAEQEAAAYELGAILICILLSAAGLGFAALVINRWIVGRPLRQLVEQARAGKRGSSPRARQFNARDDEIGEIGREMERMDDQLTRSLGDAAAEHSARNETLEQLRHTERLATMGKLAAGIAHELGTPLNVVVGRAEMIASGNLTGPEVQKSARIVVAQGQRMTQILRQLMGFARRDVSPKVKADVVAIARQTVAMLRSMASGRNIGLKLDAPGTPAEALVVANQLEQALANLIVNAIQAMKHGGEITVAVREEATRPPAEVGLASGEYVRLEVRDEGEGIAPELLPKVFDPFFTTKPVGEGTGLGLSVAYGIVRELDGWIDAASEPTHGSTFTIHLPLAAGSSWKLPVHPSL